MENDLKAPRKPTVVVIKHYYRDNTMAMDTRVKRLVN